MRPPDADQEPAPYPLPDETLDALFLRLRARFLARLPSLPGLLQETSRHLVEGRWERDFLRRTHVVLHGLIGAAATFELPRLAESARTTAFLLRRLLESEEEPRGELGERLVGYLAELQSRLHAAAHVPPTGKVEGVRAEGRACGLEEPAVWLVGELATARERLLLELDKRGIRPRFFPDLPSARQELARGELPGSALVDAAVLEEATLSRFLPESQRLEGDRIPLVVLSGEDRFFDRLQAVRLGGTHFFTGPVDLYPLLKALTPWRQGRPVDPHRVLVVDDEELLAQWYGAILETAGMEVAILSDPFQVLEALTSFRPELIVLDVHMPGCLGTEVAVLVRQHASFARTPLLFISSERSLARELSDMSRPGASLLDTGFLSKPIPPPALVEAVSLRIERARSIRNAEEGLRAALREMENLQYAMNQHAIVSAADTAGRILYVNDKFCETSGYTVNELIGQNHRIVRSGHHSSDFYRQLWETIAAGRVWHGQIQNRRKDGAPYWVEATIVPLQNDQGKPYEYISIRTEITLLKRLEEQSRTMALFAELNPLPVLRVDGAGRILAANPAAARILGMGGGEGGSILSWLPREGFPDLDDLIHCNRTLFFEVPCGDEVHQFQVIGVPELSAAHVYGANVTELKKAQAGLAAAKELAETANQAKSEFLSSMSHELRTPMNAVLGFAQLLESDPEEPLTPSQRDSIQEIIKAGAHLLELINEVLDLAKIEAGRIELAPEAVDLTQLAGECVTLVSALAANRGILFEGTPVGAGRECFVMADRTRLKQCLLNLLSNAIKYNREGGKVLLEVSPPQPGRWRLSVRDTGHGIPSGKLVRVFEPFNRLGAEHSEVEGTGIGLVITRRLIEMMQGAIGVESVVNEGSHFWIELPRVESAARDRKGEETAAAGEEEASQEKDRAILLYVEDNPANLKLVKKLLQRRAEVTLLAAPSPGLGLDLAQAFRPRVILLDINLPGMDGYEMLAHLRKNPETAAIPVVAVSANALPRDIERGRQAGFHDYLTKPIQVDRFFAVLDGLLNHGSLDAS